MKANADMNMGVIWDTKFRNRLVCSEGAASFTIFVKGAGFSSLRLQTGRLLNFLPLDTVRWLGYTALYNHSIEFENGWQRRVAPPARPGWSRGRRKSMRILSRWIARTAVAGCLLWT